MLYRLSYMYVCVYTHTHKQKYVWSYSTFCRELEQEIQHYRKWSSKLSILWSCHAVGQSVLHSAESQVSSAWYFLTCESSVFQPYHCPKAGVLRLWYVFPFMVQNSLSSKEKEPWINATWSFLQRITWMFGCLFLFLHVGQMELEASLPTALPFPTFQRRRDGFGWKMLPSCECRPKSWELFLLLHSWPLSIYTLFFYSSSTKNPLGNAVQRLSWQTQRRVRHYQETQNFFL